MRFALVASMLVACGYPRPADVPDDGPPAPTAQFEFPRSGADEQSGLLAIPVVLSAPSDQAVTVECATLVGGTALELQDYELDSAELTFEAGQVRGEIKVRILPDLNEVEAEELFTLALSSTTAEINPSAAIHEVRIADHLLPRLGFMTASSSTSETQSTMLVVQLTAPSEGVSTFVIGMSGGTAGVEDVTLADGMVISVPDGLQSVNVPIGEVDDAFDELATENVVFELKGASPNLVISPNRFLDHSITDNDPTPAVLFSVASSTVQEDGVTLTVVVSLTAESGLPITVNYARSNASTASLADAVVNGTSLSFSPHVVGVAGEVQKSFTVTVTDDVVDEPDETVIIDLLNPANATIGSIASHVATIIDND